MEDLAMSSAIDEEVSEAHDIVENDSRNEVKNTGRDLRKFFAAGARTSSAAASHGDSAGKLRSSQGSVSAVASSQTQPSLVLSAFNLSLSAVQDVPLFALQPPLALIDEQLEQAILSSPVAIADVKDVVPLLVATAPLLPSGHAIFVRLPGKWIDLSGRSDALGTRCLFASRRHEHSVFAPLPVERLLQVPCAAREWQPALQVPAEFLQKHGGGASLATEEPWAVEVHPTRSEIRVVVRPGILLARMLRRGTALPAAVFAWRVLDTSKESPDKSMTPLRGLSHDVGEFSILCNVEDAAHTQPPRFLEYPLRIEQLRSLGWMILQERRRRDPFVTELREAAPCADAPHWRLEGSLRCEYRDVKGGVLADAIGYGKTACTIGLIDCTSAEPAAEVPKSCRGLIPSRATLVLAPTNLHAQWLAEIQKFTGNALKVLSVPTCAQLKKLAPKELMEADVVVATYRLFYSTPYLQRLQELARERRPEFAFPRLPQSSTSAEWAKAYREAFESLPTWGATLQGLGEEDPVTPAKLTKSQGAEAEVTPELVSPQVSQSQTRRMHRKQKGPELSASPSNAQGEEATKPAKRRRTDAASEGSAAAGRDDPTSWASTPVYAPLEAFWWKRVVCDEFHELLSRYPPAQVAVELFHAEYKWGLSGTPPCQTLMQIRKAAGFFGVQIPTAAAVDDGGEAPRKVAQEWLDAFVRRNTAEVPALEEEERIIPVHLTPKERALYSALTQQPHMQAAVTAEEEEATDADASLQVVPEPPEILAARTSASGLLKLCSHFCPSGAAEVLSAEDECERQLALRREEARVAEREVRSHVERAAQTVQLVRHFEPHFCAAPDRMANAHIYGFIENLPRPAVAARLKFLAAPTTGSKAQLIARLFEVLCDASTAEQVKEMLLRVDFDVKAAGSLAKLKAQSVPTWKTMEALATGTLVESPINGESVVARMLREVSAQTSEGSQSIPQRCARLRNTQGMPRWPLSIRAGVSKDDLSEGDAKKRSDYEQANWDWLANSANAASLRSVITAWKLDIERNAAKALELGEIAASKLQNLRSFTETLHASQMPVDSSVVPVEVAAPHFAKYGSKIEKLVKHVLQLQDADPGCKCICFVQWEDLKRKISSALTEFGVEHLSLHGSVWNRRAALMRFQYEADSPRMLLLSLEESASGTNLTAANHVLIVHPMEAATRDEAVAFEMQAVGRVRRPGQQRKIHIWRFVTVDTVEQEITEEHQKELWERQQAAQHFSQVVMESQQMQLAPVQEEREEEDVDEKPILEESSTQLYGIQIAPKEDLQECSTQLYMGENAQTGHLLHAKAVVPPDSEMLDAEAETQCFEPMACETQCFEPMACADDMCTQRY